MTKAQQLVARAQQELAAGKQSAALRSSWEAVQSAMLAQDEAPVRDVQVIVTAIEEQSDGSVHAEAEKLAAYCVALLDGVGGGVRAPSLIERMFGGGRRAERQSRRRCPECAEDIAADAKVCRYCHVRLDGAPDEPSL